MRNTLLYCALPMFKKFIETETIAHLALFVNAIRVSKTLASPSNTSAFPLWKKIIHNELLLAPSWATIVRR